MSDDKTNTCVSCAFFAALDAVETARGSSIDAMEIAAALGAVAGGVVAGCKVAGAPQSYIDTFFKQIGRAAYEHEQAALAEPMQEARH